MFEISKFINWFKIVFIARNSIYFLSQNAMYLKSQEPRGPQITLLGITRYIRKNKYDQTIEKV